MIARSSSHTRAAAGFTSPSQGPDRQPRTSRRASPSIVWTRERLIRLQQSMKVEQCRLAGDRGWWGENHDRVGQEISVGASASRARAGRNGAGGGGGDFGGRLAPESPVAAGRCAADGRLDQNWSERPRRLHPAARAGGPIRAICCSWRSRAGLRAACQRSESRQFGFLHTLEAQKIPAGFHDSFAVTRMPRTQGVLASPAPLHTGSDRLSRTTSDRRRPASPNSAGANALAMTVKTTPCIKASSTASPGDSLRGGSGPFSRSNELRKR